ncbi:hypothetical protein HGG71_05705 [Rhodobacteraceae bacterium R_SAG2]|nr:hypothetical protein [Rhodobacteraceae bacterium R_SAG2]
MSNALDELIAKVERGTADQNWRGYQSLDTAHWEPTRKAFNGSLDAALALHEAALPGWVVHDMGNNSKSMGWTVVIASPEGVYASSHKGKKSRQECPARAWLLAVLRALSEEGQA